MVIEVDYVTQSNGRIWLKTFRLLEPDKKWHGVNIHFVDPILLDKEPQLKKGLQALGLRAVYYDIDKRYLYFAKMIPSFFASTVHTFYRLYWGIIRWFYLYGRFFQEIPLNERFSWRYFTPFVFFKRVSKKFKQSNKG